MVAEVRRREADRGSFTGFAGFTDICLYVHFICLDCMRMNPNTLSFAVLFVLCLEPVGEDMATRSIISSCGLKSNEAIAPAKCSGQ